MGHVTILVQHAWKMQNAHKQMDGNPAMYPINHTARMRGTADTDREVVETPLGIRPLASYVRVTVPSSIAQLVKYYNGADTSDKKAECENACRDILARLETLILSSKITDNHRVDTIRERISKNTDVLSYGDNLIFKNHPQKSKLTSLKPEIPTDDTIAIEKNRKFAAEARISALMLARCKSQFIRSSALLLLCEALDTNTLSACDHEIMHLQMLWVELVQMMRHIVDARRSRNGYDSARHKPDTPDDEIARSEVDVCLENLLTCLYLTLQRLEYIEDIGRSVQSSSLMDQSYECLLEDLSLLKTGDPYIVQLMSGIAEHVHDLQNVAFRQGKSKKEVALDVGVSILTKVMRMAPSEEFKDIQGQLLHIMEGLRNSQEWLLGKKLIKLMGTAAALDMIACIEFVHLTKMLSHLHWQWHYTSILCLGTVTCSSSSVSIRKYVLENGLIPALNYGDADTNESEPLDADDENDSNDNSWMVRAAAVVALIEVYQQYRIGTYGLIAREVMIDRASKETHPTVKMLLNTPRAKSPHSTFVKRISFLFKYTSIAFAEVYAEIQSDYQYMRKFIQTAEKDERRQKHQKSRKKKAPKQVPNTQNTQFIQSQTIEKRNKKGSKKSMYATLPLKHTPEPEYLSTRNREPTGDFKNILNVPFSTEPYHHNYQHVQLDPDDDVQNVLTTYEEDEERRQLLPRLTKSSLRDCHATYIIPGNIKDLGTADRRKMFNPMTSFVREEYKAPEKAKPATKTVKMPKVPQISIGNK
ncbi:hypothetical protein HDV02_003229 [Globomyces sp. JEL0801]|nr:hypothetical protein HDV02_003229 [Globomyces sp. JEL0801]